MGVIFVVKPPVHHKLVLITVSQLPIICLVYLYMYVHGVLPSSHS